MIDGFGDGGNGGMRNQNQVESHCLRSADSHSRGHDFDAAVGKDRPDFGSANAFVNILHYPPIVPDGFKEGRVNQTERQRTVGVRWLIPTSALVLGCRM
jgi:hypothetical protein